MKPTCVYTKLILTRSGQLDTFLNNKYIHDQLLLRTPRNKTLNKRASLVKACSHLLLRLFNNREFTINLPRIEVNRRLV